MQSAKTLEDFDSGNEIFPVDLSCEAAAGVMIDIAISLQVSLRPEKLTNKYVNQRENVSYMAAISEIPITYQSC